MIDRMINKDNIEAYLEIDKCRDCYKLVEISKDRKDLKRLDIYCALSLFENSGYTFDGMLRFLLSLIDVDNIDKIKEKRDIFCSESELKNSNDEQLINLFKVVYLQLSQESILPDNFNSSMYLKKIEERIEKVLTIEEKKDAKIEDERITPLSDILGVLDE